MNFLPELFDGSCYMVARREAWGDGKFIFGVNSRIIEAKDIESTLLLDKCVEYYIGKSKKLAVRKAFKMISKPSEFDDVEEGTVIMCDWYPTPEDMMSVDWIVEDKTEIVKSLYKKHNIEIADRKL